MIGFWCKESLTPRMISQRGRKKLRSRSRHPLRSFDTYTAEEWKEFISLRPPFSCKDTVDGNPFFSFIVRESTTRKETMTAHVDPQANHPHRLPKAIENCHCKGRQIQCNQCKWYQTEGHSISNSAPVF